MYCCLQNSRYLTHGASQARGSASSWWGNLIGSGSSSSGSSSNSKNNNNLGVSMEAGAQEQLARLDARPLGPQQLGRLAARLLVHLGRQVGTPMLKVMLTALIHTQSQFLAAASSHQSTTAQSSTGSSMKNDELDYGSAVIEALVLFCEPEPDSGGGDDVGGAGGNADADADARACVAARPKKDSGEQLRSLIKSDFANGKAGAKKRALLFGRLLVLAAAPALRYCAWGANGDACPKEVSRPIPCFCWLFSPPCPLQLHTRCRPIPVLSCTDVSVTPVVVAVVAVVAVLLLSLLLSSLLLVVVVVLLTSLLSLASQTPAGEAAPTQLLATAAKLPAVSHRRPISKQVPEQT